MLINLLIWVLLSLRTPQLTKKDWEKLLLCLGA